MIYPHFFIEVYQTQQTLMILLCWNESKDCFCSENLALYTTCYYWPITVKQFMINGSQMYQYPVVIPYKMSWIWTWIQLLFPLFFTSRTTNQHKKSTITININVKQLKSTKCFKYIKCSISNSFVVEKMLARVDREAVCNNHLLLFTKLMKLLLCDVWCTYNHHNALNDSQLILNISQLN